MNFQSMTYFVATARERSFTRAAQALCITQQTLSAHIAAIEKELGCPLFVRHIPLELTYAGEVFYRYAESFQRQYQDLQNTFADITQQRQGILRVGLAPTRARAVMPDLIQAFQREYPQVEIQIFKATNDELAPRLLNGELDVAISNFPEKIPGIELMNFYRERVILLIASDLLAERYGAEAPEIVRQVRETGSLAPLKDCPFLMNHQEDIAGRFARSAMVKAGFEPKIRAQSDNVELLLDLCRRNAGACFCPEILARMVLSRKQWAQMTIIRFDSAAEFQIRLGWPEKSDTWSILTAFTETARQIARQMNR